MAGRAVVGLGRSAHNLCACGSPRAHFLGALTLVLGGPSHQRGPESGRQEGAEEAEVDEISRWRTGHSREALDNVMADRTTFAGASVLNPARSPRGADSVLYLAQPSGGHG